MAPRKRKKAPVGEGLFMFSEEEMAGNIENVTIVKAPESAKTNKSSIVNNEVSETKAEPQQPVAEPLSDDRMIAEMGSVLRQKVSLVWILIRPIRCLFYEIQRLLAMNWLLGATVVSWKLSHK